MYKKFLRTCAYILICVTTVCMCSVSAMEDDDYDLVRSQTINSGTIYVYTQPRVRLCDVKTNYNSYTETYDWPDAAPRIKSAIEEMLKKYHPEITSACVTSMTPHINYQDTNIWGAKIESVDYDVKLTPSGCWQKISERKNLGYQTENNKPQQLTVTERKEQKNRRFWGTFSNFCCCYIGYFCEGDCCCNPCTCPY